MPVFIEHTRAVNAHENDGKCIAQVTALMKAGTFRMISDPELNCRELKTLYGCFDYIIGTRFHSVIFSFGWNIPGIAVSYTGNKTE